MYCDESDVIFGVPPLVGLEGEHEAEQFAVVVGVCGSEARFGWRRKL